MDKDLMNELFVEVSSAFQAELTKRILDFIKNTKKQKRWWRRFVRWLGSIKHLSCVCGPSGVGCRCDIPEPPPPPIHLLPVRCASRVATIREVSEV